MPASSKKQKPAEWVWDIDLDALKGCNAHIETMDGFHREGRISDVSFSTFILGGEEVELPKALQLNGDPMDEIPINTLKRVDIIGSS